MYITHCDIFFSVISKHFRQLLFSFKHRRYLSYPRLRINSTYCMYFSAEKVVLRIAIEFENAMEEFYTGRRTLADRRFANYVHIFFYFTTRCLFSEGKL